MSLGEVKGQLLAAAGMLEEVSGMVNGASILAQDGVAMATVAFEGSGDQDLFATIGRCGQLKLDMSSVILEAMSLAARLRATAARL